jgi:hypothetical protein
MAISKQKTNSYQKTKIKKIALFIFIVLLRIKNWKINNNKIIRILIKILIYY